MAMKSKEIWEVKSPMKELKRQRFEVTIKKYPEIWGTKVPPFKIGLMPIAGGIWFGGQLLIHGGDVVSRKEDEIERRQELKGEGPDLPPGLMQIRLDSLSGYSLPESGVKGTTEALDLDDQAWTYMCGYT
ncbi:hypothetical protein QJS10_CPB15g01816 [Acorus calamus]|uniref:Uncharacterized protein n=1 Tax=Acorus calamus TaxID=4465 RepID=A0AAV9D4B9_ACOCL|nr:hypothetical protein QJS10_CPB15g01816 [Acorus calamus]